MIERFNRTLKSKMFKQFTIQGDRKWIDILDNLVKKYNNTIHRTIKLKPIDAYNKDLLISTNIIDDRLPTEPKFKVGDRIRISYKRGVFDKSYLPSWSHQIYFINEIINSNPTTYKIENERHEIIKGSFYAEELQKSKTKENVYLVEKLLKSRIRNGKKEHFVKWLGYNELFNSWEPDENIAHQLKNINRL